MSIFEIARAVGVRDERVETEHQAGAEDGDDVIEDTAQTDGADGDCAIRLAADHHRVDDSHRHPAEFGQNDGRGQADHGTELLRRCSVKKGA